MTVPLCTMKAPHFDELLRVDFYGYTPQHC